MGTALGHQAEWGFPFQKRITRPETRFGWHIALRQIMLATVFGRCHVQENHSLVCEL